MHTAAIITGASQQFMPLVEHFAESVLQDEDSPFQKLVLINQRGADEALAGADWTMPPPEQEAVREAVRTKTYLAWLRYKITHCVVVTAIDLSWSESGFEEGKKFALREWEQIWKWHFFGNNIRVGFFTPEGAIALLY